MSEQEDVLQMLKNALQQQRRSVKAYEMMLAVAPQPPDRRLLATMQREERRHYYQLEGIFEELNGKAYRPERLQLSLPKQYITMLQVMIRDKLDSIDYYEQLDQALHCVKQRELMAIIISDQKEQARILATIYQRNT